MNLTYTQKYDSKLSIKVLLITILLSAITFSANANYKSEIVESCRAYQAGTDKNHVNACKLYIDGFIDAALYTESAILVKKSKETAEKQSAFMQRVYKTRTTRNISSELGNINYQFCLNDNADRKSVASQIAKSLNISALKNAPLKKVLFETLTTTFPCES